MRRHDSGVRHADGGGVARGRTAAVRVATAQPAARSDGVRSGRLLASSVGGNGPLFPLHTRPVSTVAMLSCVVAGLASGGAVIGHDDRALYRIEDGFARLPVHWMWWPALGGLVVGIGGFIQPRALGVGYDVIGDLLANHLLLSTVVALILVKTIIWAVALGSGTSGGVLAPLLMIGAGLGCVSRPMAARRRSALWALVCMAATLGGTMRAPLTAVVFAFGLTHDANAFPPTLLGCAVAYGFTVIVMPRSILTEKIARRGQHVFREYGLDPLERHFIDEVMTRDVVAIPAEMTSGRVLREFFGSDQRHRAYPVVRDQQALGMIDRGLLAGLSPEALERSLASLATLDSLAAYAVSGETCRSVATRMAAAGLERLPVLDSSETRRLIGIVSRSDLLKPTHYLHQEESEREGVIGLG